jgi:hypothetical protein
MRQERKPLKGRRLLLEAPARRAQMLGMDCDRRGSCTLKILSELILNNLKKANATVGE